jgi:flagellar protein FlbD
MLVASQNLESSNRHSCDPLLAPIRRLVISLTRINDRPLILNCDLIQYIEQDHDTVVTLYGGDKLRVRETPQEIVARVLAYRRQIPVAPPPPRAALAEASRG